MMKFGLLLMLLLVACSPAATPEPTLAPTLPPPPPTATPEPPEPTVQAAAADVEPAEDIADTEMDEPEMVEAEPQAEVVASVDRPAWHNLALTDSRSGESFTLADFAGKTVYVEPMATWCPICRAQQQSVIPVFEQLDSGDYIFLSLSVGESVSDSTLASYADAAGFNWTFAIASPEMMSALADQFGRGVLSPPSTPHFFILPDGTTTDLTTGSESTDALIARLTGA
jgi:thiol-disulfide isomerase/thioredoxin